MTKSGRKQCTLYMYYATVLFFLVCVCVLCKYFPNKTMCSCRLHTSWTHSKLSTIKLPFQTIELTAGIVRTTEFIQDVGELSNWLVPDFIHCALFPSGAAAQLHSKISVISRKLTEARRKGGRLAQLNKPLQRHNNWITQLFLLNLHKSYSSFFIIKFTQNSLS